MTNALLKIEHNGVTIRNSDGGEFYNLTDMWRACGSDLSKRPADWQRKEGAQFIEFIADSQGVPVEHLLKKLPGNPQKGEGGSTMAHWQIALAYAKYLSHEFHAQCNTVIRAFAEGKLQGETTAKDRLLERIVLSLPKPRDKQWQQDVIDSVAKVYGHPGRNSKGGAPVFLRSVQAKFVRMFFGDDVHGRLKELADGSGCRQYEHMTEDALWAFNELLTALRVTASQSSDRDTLSSKMRQYCDFRHGFGTQLELPRLGLTCECGHSLDGHAKFCPECGTRVCHA